MKVQAKYLETKENGVRCYETPLPCPTPFGMVKQFKAAGEYLPTVEDELYDFEGVWSVDVNGETMMECTNCTHVFPHEREDVLQYLMKLTGFGRKRVWNDLYAIYKDGVRYIFDCELDHLRDYVRISKGNFRRVRKEYLRQTKYQMFEALMKYGASETAVLRAYDLFRYDIMNVIRNDPYRLVSVKGISFDMADRLALDNGVERNSFQRCKAGVLAALSETESGGELLRNYNKSAERKIQSGSTCLRWDEMESFSNYILGGDMPPFLIEDSIMEMNGTEIAINDDFVFSEEMNENEEQTAKDIARILSNKPRFTISRETVEELMDEMIDVGGVAGRLSNEQIGAVCNAINNCMAITTGGPGTGKTMITKATLYLIRKFVPDAKIVLIAPTGKAARRMTESTGYPASTIHSLLKMDGESSYEDAQKIDADYIIVDEFSMCDQAVARALFASVEDGTQIVCVGDQYQLASVGAGSVLREMLASKSIPTAMLTEVFRQKNGSYINVNAKNINQGVQDMVYDNTFIFVDAKKDDIIKQTIKSFKEMSEEFGVDETCVLTPFRVSTDTGVNHINQIIRSEVNQKSKQSKSRVCAGDRVMYMKNKDGLANGDVGTVLEDNPEEMSVVVDFGLEDPVTIKDEDLDNLVLAYSTTIHKSQGSEYKAVILVMDPKHSIMHKRNLVYTAVTRAKAKIVIIGSKKAFMDSILDNDADLRESLLAKRIRESCR